MKPVVVVIAVACYSSFVSAIFPSYPRNPAIPLANTPLDSNEAIFEQLIDHNNPSLGTFPQRYWWDIGFWNGTGSPIIVFNPGEVPVVGAANGDDFRGYLYATTLTGQYAAAVGGATIVIEHRYWGTSSPFTNLNAETLQYLTVAQSIQDMTYFANNVKLAFDATGNSNAAKAPWVLVGGSYSGALAAWTAVRAPGTFWAYHASSAPVQAIENYWEYFPPIQKGMPVNCSSDLAAVIEQIDAILTTGTDSDKLALKSSFGLSTVLHDTDFAQQLTRPLDLWQVSISTFLPFCDVLEGVVPGQAGLPGPGGVGLTAALKNLASYFQTNYACYVPDCFDSYNPSDYWYTDTAYDPTVEAGKQWEWMLCNEALGYWQTGAPAGQTTIVSRLITADYWQRQCDLYFPGVTFGLTEDQHNALYMGWNIENSTRLMFSNGEFDPWRSAGVSSEFRPGGPVASTADMPIFILPDGIHVQDIYMADVTPEILAVRAQEIAQMSSWIAEYYQRSVSTSSTAASSSSISFTIPSLSLSSSTAPSSVTSIPLVGLQPTLPLGYSNLTSTPISTSIAPVATNTAPSTTPPSQGSAQSLSSQYNSSNLGGAGTATITTVASSTEVTPSQFTGTAVQSLSGGSMFLLLRVMGTLLPLVVIELF